MTLKEADIDRKNAAEGLTTLPSRFGPKETMDRLAADVMAQGMRVFVRIDHAALAVEAGLTLLPTELLIFGNPRAGTALMQANQTTGIDLPLKALVWQDSSGKTWLTYNDPGWVAHRHGTAPDADQAAGTMALALAVTSRKAAGD